MLWDLCNADKVELCLLLLLYFVLLKCIPAFICYPMINFDVTSNLINIILGEVHVFVVYYPLSVEV